MGMGHRIDKSDVIPLVNYAWADSFARIASNKRAICQRGWNPLNQAILLHPDILKTKIQEVEPSSIDSTTVTSQSSTISSLTTSSSGDINLNIVNGFAGACVTDLMQEAMRSRAVHDNLKKRYTEGKNLKEDIDNSKKLKAGKLFLSEQVLLDEDVLLCIEEGQKQDIRKRKKQVEAIVKDYLSRKKIMKGHSSLLMMRNL